MSMPELGPVAFGGTPGIIAFLQGKQVLARHKQCPCGSAMVLQEIKGQTSAMATVGNVLIAARLSASEVRVSLESRGWHYISSSFLSRCNRCLRGNWGFRAHRITSIAG